MDSKDNTSKVQVFAIIALFAVIISSIIVNNQSDKKITDTIKSNEEAADTLVDEKTVVSEKQKPKPIDYRKPPNGSGSFIAKGKPLVKNMKFKSYFKRFERYEDVTVVVDWEDGVQSAYTLGNEQFDDPTFIRSEDPKSDFLKITDFDASWKYRDNDIIVISKNGAETILGGLAASVKEKVEARRDKEMNRQAELASMTLEDYYSKIATKACRTLETSSRLNNQTFVQALRDAQMSIPTSETIGMQWTSLNNQVKGKKLESIMMWECNAAMQVIYENRINQQINEAYVRSLLFN